MQCCAGVNPLIDLSSNVALIYGRMDRELLRQCLAYHGEPLLNKLKCEQTENPDFQAVVSDLSKATHERYVDEGFCKRAATQVYDAFPRKTFQ